MIRKYLKTPLFLMCLAAPLANAANMDLTTFYFDGPNRASGWSSANYAFIPGGSVFINNAVSNIASFDWNFTDTTLRGDGFVFLETPNNGVGSTFLASTRSLGSKFTTGWQTYTLEVPYSGSALFFSASIHPDNSTFLEIRNLATSAAAVPEPETYAMLLAGLGLMAGIARRRSRRTGNPSVRNIPAIPIAH